MAKGKQNYYLFFKTDLKDIFRVSKLDEDQEPVDSYTTSISKGTVNNCNCPAYTKNCKHIRFAKKWAKEGCPENVVLNSITEEFEEYLLDL